MKIILTDYVPNLGESHDVVEVKPGYANNYLLPKGLARIATPSALKDIREAERQAAHKRQKELEEAQEKAIQLEEMSLKIEMLVGDNGYIFGSVTPTQLANAIREQGIEVDRRRVKILDDVREVGNFNAEVELHKEVKQPIKFDVVPRGEG